MKMKTSKLITITALVALFMSVGLYANAEALGSFFLVLLAIPVCLICLVGKIIMEIPMVVFLVAILVVLWQILKAVSSRK